MVSEAMFELYGQIIESQLIEQGSLASIVFAGQPVFPTPEIVRNLGGRFSSVANNLQLAVVDLPAIHQSGVVSCPLATEAAGLHLELVALVCHFHEPLGPGEEFALEAGQARPYA